RLRFLPAATSQVKPPHPCSTARPSSNSTTARFSSRGTPAGRKQRVTPEFWCAIQSPAAPVGSRRRQQLFLAGARPDQGSQTRHLGTPPCFKIRKTSSGYFTRQSNLAAGVARISSTKRRAIAAEPGRKRID